MVSLGAPNPPVRRPRPNNGVAFTTPSRSDYRSTCTVCRLGIFTGDDTVWGCGRLMGLMHAACARQAGATVVAEASRPAEPRPEAVARPKPATRPAQHSRTGGVLTPRQIAVIRLVAEGHTLTQVAEIDGISIGAVKNALHRARTRTGVADNAALIEAARRHGLVPTNDSRSGS